MSIPSTSKLFNFHTIADDSVTQILLNCPFRESVRVFLQEFAEPKDYTIQGMTVWCTLLVHKNHRLKVPLYTIEEDVKVSSKPYCDHCRCTGWSNHYVSKRTYHFLIPDDTSWSKPVGEGIFDAPSNLLHGLIHCNGLGHLICVNGIEGGSKFLLGRETMDLWDQICNALHARKITVADSSKKRTMELRLLHGVAYKHPWFGRWGYGFCHGSFGVREDNYNIATEILCSLELEKIMEDFSGTDRSHDIKKIIGINRHLSEGRLKTLNDLLRFMLTFKSRTEYKPAKDNKPDVIVNKQFSTVSSERWTPSRLKSAADVIVGALKEKMENCHYGTTGMTRKDLHAAARLQVGNTGLLDFVLKSIKNVNVGNYIVRWVDNPAIRMHEYTIHQSENSAAAKGSESSYQDSVPIPSPMITPGIDIYNDIIILYKYVLMEYPDSELVKLATQPILDTKRFVKEWPVNNKSTWTLTFIAKYGTTSIDDAQIGEVVTVPIHATLGQLKAAVKCALRDTYCVMETVEVTEIVGWEVINENDAVFDKVESGTVIRVRVSGVDLEGGFDALRVECVCGARYDDGECMLKCPICNLWQHTRCCGIEATFPGFVCRSCCTKLADEISDEPLL